MSPFDDVRCRLSGILLRSSPRCAGLLYRRFGQHLVGLAAFCLLAAAALAVLAARLP
jgi:hypothetical protein